MKTTRQDIRPSKRCRKQTLRSDKEVLEPPHNVEKAGRGKIRTYEM